MSATASDSQCVSTNEMKKKDVKSSDSTRTAVTTCQKKQKNKTKAAAQEIVTTIVAPTDTATVPGDDTTISEPKSSLRKKRKITVPEEPSDSVKRIALKAGYNGKEGGVEGIGCQHYTMAQMRQYAICNKASRDYYMAEGRFLHGRTCHTCDKKADDIDITKSKLLPDNAFIIYCNFGVLKKDTRKKNMNDSTENKPSAQETPLDGVENEVPMEGDNKKTPPQLCQWYCSTCYTTWAAKEADVEVGGRRPKRQCKVAV